MDYNESFWRTSGSEGDAAAEARPESRPRRSGSRSPPPPRAGVWQKKGKGPRRKGEDGTVGTSEPALSSAAARAAHTADALDALAALLLGAAPGSNATDSPDSQEHELSA